MGRLIYQPDGDFRIAAIGGQQNKKIKKIFLREVTGNIILKKNSYFSGIAIAAKIIGVMTIINTFLDHPGFFALIIIKCLIHFIERLIGNIPRKSSAESVSKHSRPLNILMVRHWWYILTIL